MVPLKLAPSFIPQASLGDQAELASDYFHNTPHQISYPTQPQLQSDFEQHEFTAWEKQYSQSTSAPLSLYVHLPFCKDLCYFCSCNKVITSKRGVASEYLGHLQNEIAKRAETSGEQRPVKSMHWGGGTPNYLDSAELTRLMHTLASHFNLLADETRQYSIEIDPRHAEEPTIALLKGLGFNRISIGVQDLDPLVQRAINRVQPLRQIAELVSNVRTHGFSKLTFDLVYGLPHQDSWTMAETLKKVIDLRPDSIACRGYSHMPKVFSAQFGIDQNALPNAAQSLDLLKLIHETLSDAGYIDVGIDHFVLAKEPPAQEPGSQAKRAESEYSAPYDLLGLGVSAISHIGEYVVQNESTLEGYYQRTKLRELPIERGLRLSEEDKIRRFIILSFATQQRVEFEQLSIRFGINFQEKFAAELSSLRGMHDIGLLEINDQKIAITPSGRPFLRTVCTYFDCYLDRGPIASLACGNALADHKKQRG